MKGEDELGIFNMVPDISNSGNFYWYVFFWVKGPIDFIKQTPNGEELWYFPTQVYLSGRIVFGN